MAYVVTGERVTVTTQVNKGEKDDDGNDARPRFAGRDFYRGDDVPEDAPDAEVQTYLRRGEIAKKGTKAAKTAASSDGDK
jgi:hypothetical protein